MVKNKISTFSLFCLVLFFTVPLALAQAPDEEGTVAGQTQEEKIQDLKERVATKVAQMRISTFRVLIGEVKSVDKESLILKTAQGERKVLTTSETAIFRLTRGRKTALSLANIKAGERAAIVGSSDAEGEFVAKTIFVKTMPLNINGVIEEMDPENFTISVKNKQKGLTYLVDIETLTKIQTWKKGVGFEKLGFSKLEVGNRVHVNGTLLPEEQNRLSAIRVLVLPGEAVGITGPTPTTSPSPTTSPPVETPTPIP